MAKVYLDAGHGGSDPGAIGNGLKEKDLTLSIAKHARDYLQSNYKGVSVRMSRTSDKTLSLTQRTNDANSWGADVFVSVHINAGGGIGYEDFIYNGSVSNDTKKLQDCIHNEVAPLFTKNRGQKRANFAVVRQTKMPAVLTENGFIDNKTDADFLSKDSNLKKIGEAHAKGIAVYLGLEKGNSKPKKKSTPKKTTSKKTAKPKANLKVDGKWGPATTKALQKALGLKNRDGILSSQPKNSVTRALYGGVTWGSKGSPTVRALQRKVGASQDGKLGPATVRAMQKHLGTPVDGVISRPSSLVVKELQKRLNNGTF